MFKNKIEMAKFMLDGGKLYTSSIAEIILYFDEEKMKFVSDKIGENGRSQEFSNNSVFWEQCDAVSEYKEPEWYDDIPKQGVLCLAGVSENAPSWVIAIYSSSKNPLRFHDGSGVAYTKATPLSDGAIKMFLRDE